MLPIVVGLAAFAVFALGALFGAWVAESAAGEPDLVELVETD